jgi:GNAT superfamily N-acetyltransferase
MRSDVTIEIARAEDIAALPSIERDAASLFAGWAIPLAVLQEQTPIHEFAAAQREGHLWVARTHTGVVVGFALVDLVGGQPHLEEMDVHRSHGRQGIGGRLLATVKVWARAAGYSALTLTTFRDVPWNAPFYARSGFRVMFARELSPELQGVLREEAARGLDPATRVVMCCAVGAA